MSQKRHSVDQVISRLRIAALVLLGRSCCYDQWLFRVARFGNGGNPHANRYVPPANRVMELIGEVIAYVLFKPFFSICQALAGILQPTDSARLIRAQRTATVFLGFGVVAILSAIISASFGLGFWPCVYMFLAGFVLLAIASAIGHHVEKTVKKDSGEDGT